MEIFVDADACPVRGIIVSLAKKYEIPVTMLKDTSHELSGGYERIVTLDKGKDSVDIALVNLTGPGDIVVTQDYGVAAMALSKGARAISPGGKNFDDSNIEGLLFERHLGALRRRAGEKPGKHKKRRKEDDEAFYRAFETLLQNTIE